MWTCARPLSEPESMAVSFMSVRPTPRVTGIAGMVSDRTTEAAREMCASRQQCEFVTERSCSFLLGCCCHCLNPPFSSIFPHIPDRTSPCAIPSSDERGQTRRHMQRARHGEVGYGGFGGAGNPLRVCESCCAPPLLTPPRVRGRIIVENTTRTHACSTHTCTQYTHEWARAHHTHAHKKEMRMHACTHIQTS